MSEVSFVPNSDRVLCDLEVRESSAGGIIYAPSAKNTDALEATVIAVGPGREWHLQTVVSGGCSLETSTLRPLPYKAGDVVLLDPIGGLNVTLNGKKYKLLRCEEILGKIR